MVHAITTSICTCCTSLVMRVISDGAPNVPDLPRREVGDLVEEVACAGHGRSSWRPCRRNRPRRPRTATWTSAKNDMTAAPRGDVAAGCAGEHAVVDDVGVDRRQGQRGRGLHRLQEDDQPQRLLVRTQVVAEQSLSTADPAPATADTVRNRCTISAGSSGSPTSIGCVADKRERAQQRAATIGSTVIPSRCASKRRHERVAVGDRPAASSWNRVPTLDTRPPHVDHPLLDDHDRRVQAAVNGKVGGIAASAVSSGSVSSAAR